MSLHRCAACGSRNVVVDTQSGGVSYNYKKGLAGTVVFGTGGAAAGIESKLQEVFKCQDCGMTLTYEMPDDLRTAIDIGVDNEKARSSLKVSGLTFNWDRLKVRYKNIEKGIADKCIADRKERQYNGLLCFATASQEEFDTAIDYIVKCDKWYGEERLRSMSLIEYTELKNAANIVVENAVKFLPKSFRNFSKIGREEYRCFSVVDLFYVFVAYIYENYYIECGGHYPKHIFRSLEAEYCKDLEEYAKSNFYILDFANEFYSHIDGELDEIYWEANNFAENFMQVYFSGPAMFRASMPYVSCFSFRPQELRKTIYCVIPKFRIKDGKLYYNKMQTFKLNDAMSAYFAIYPEKYSEYDNRIKMYQIQLTENEAVKQKINNNEEAIDDNDSASMRKRQEIDRLHKKIFGRKTAYAKADVLENEIHQLQEQNNILADEIESLKKQMSETNETLPEGEFYAQLLEDMDYFMVWQYVDDVE